MCARRTHVQRYCQGNRCKLLNLRDSNARNLDSPLQCWCSRIGKGCNIALFLPESMVEETSYRTFFLLRLHTLKISLSLPQRMKAANNLRRLEKRSLRLCCRIVLIFSLVTCLIVWCGCNPGLRTSGLTARGIFPLMENLAGTKLT